MSSYTGKKGFFSCKMTDKWENTLGLRACCRKLLSEWPFPYLCCLPMSPVHPSASSPLLLWWTEAVTHQPKDKLRLSSSSLFQIADQVFQKDCFMSSCSLLLCHSFVQQIPGRHMLPHNTYMI